MRYLVLHGFFLLGCALLVWAGKTDPFGLKFWLPLFGLAAGAPALLIALWWQGRHTTSTWKRVAAWLFGAVGLVGLTLWAVATASPKSIFHSFAKVTSTEAWLRDLDFLEKEVPRRHVDFFKIMPTERWSASISDFKQKLPGWSDAVRKLELIKLVAACKVSHSQVELSQFGLDLNAFPLSLHHFDDGYFVVRTAKAYKNLEGRRVTHFGAMPIEEVFQKIQPYLGAENPSGDQHFFPVFVMIGELLAHEGIIQSFDFLPLKLAAEGGLPTEVEVRAAPMSTFMLWYLQPFHKDSRELSTADFCASREPFWYKWLPDSKALFIQINAIEQDSKSPLRDFTAGLKEEMLKSQPEKVILDLRNNGGGNNLLNRHWLRLAKLPEVNQPGRLFVLIGRHTGSAALNLVSVLEKQTAAILVGEPTLAGHNQYGDAAPLTLPETGIVVQLSTHLHLGSIADDSRPTIEPEIPAPCFSTDFKSGRDAVLEKVIGWQAVQPPASLPESFQKLAGKYLFSPWQQAEISLQKDGWMLVITDFTNDEASMSEVSTRLQAQSDTFCLTEIKDVRCLLRNGSLLIDWSSVEKPLLPLPAGYVFPGQLLELGRHDELVAFANRNPEQFPPHLESIINDRGYEHLTKKELKQAVQLFELNIRLFPNSFNSFDSLGEAYLAQGEPAKAKASFEKALVLNPGFEHSKMMLKSIE